jgi:hypothetical protein
MPILLLEPLVRSDARALARNEAGVAWTLLAMLINISANTKYRSPRNRGSLRTISPSNSFALPTAFALRFGSTRPRSMRPQAADFRL